MKKRIAIIGGGVAGLTAGYLLHRQHDITLFEKSGRLGGNAWSHRTHDGEQVDIAVAAFGRAGYPNFYALLAELGVHTRLCLGSFMSFYDLDQRDGLFMTPWPRALKLQDYRLFNPRNFLRVVQFFSALARAQQQLRAQALEGLSFEAWLDRTPQLDRQTRIVLICALCLLSSMSADEVLATPAAFFIEKLAVHHDVLSPRAAYSVRCVDQGTQAYVRALSQDWLDRVQLHSRLRTVSRSGETVTLRCEDGSARTFDAVIFACNADQALALLEAPSAQERELLGAWRYKEGAVVLHRDLTSFPPRPLVQAYTFLYTDRGGVISTSVNGALWHLPSASPTCEYVSSQHPNFPIRPELIELETTLRTPMFDARSIATRAALDSLNGQKQTYYCGSHFGFGLHEDAVRSAMRCAELLGAPFRPRPVPPSDRLAELALDVTGVARRLRSRFI